MRSTSASQRQPDQTTFQPSLFFPDEQVRLKLPNVGDLAEAKPKFVDLFAGCGGLSLGLHWAGWKGVLAVEHDKMAFDSLNFNLINRLKVFEEWPDEIEKEPLDVHELSDGRLTQFVQQLRGKVTLLAGGPPCQGFSVAGARNGQDERNSLVEAFLKVAEHLQPPMLLIENVEGMDLAFKSRPGKSDISVAQEIMIYLDQFLNYKAFTDVLDASLYGVPQTRNRLFIFAVRKDIADQLEDNEIDLFHQMRSLRIAFLESKNLPIDRAVSVNEALEDLDSEDVIDCPDSPKFKAARYVSQPRSAYGKSMRDSNLSNIPDSHRYPNHGKIVLDRYKLIQSALSWGRVPRDVLKNNGTAKHRVVYLDPSKPAPTLTTSPDDFLHFRQPRIITVREMARLQSFPDTFEFKGRYTINGPRRKYDRARVSQVGNAVAPLLAEAIGHGLTSVLLNIKSFQARISHPKSNLPSLAVMK